MRLAVLPFVALALVLGACSSDTGSDDQSSNEKPASAETTAPDQADETEKANEADEADEAEDTDESADEAACDRFPAARTKSLGDGARKGVTVGKTAYAVEVGDDADDYLAVAVSVTKDGKTYPVIVAAPEEEGEGLTLATDSSLPYLNWGDLAGEGSPADDLRDSVANSDAAQEALNCL